MNDADAQILSLVRRYFAIVQTDGLDRWGLSHRTAELRAILYVYAALYLHIVPETISGFRTEADQARLVQLFEAGDPSVAVRPAKNSSHLTGQAFDLDAPSPELLRNLGGFWRTMGQVWGGDFRVRDTHHFQLSSGEKLIDIGPNI